MKRDFDPTQPELMDRDQAPTPELNTALRELAALNRGFGGHRLIRKFLELWLNRDRTYRVLDLCTGGGDIPRLMVDWARAHGVRLRIDAVDANESTIEIARGESSAYPEITYIRSDVLAFDSKQSYDLVTCTLALHHFGEEHAVTLLRGCRRLSHRFVLISDLERSVLTLLGIQALTSLFCRTPMTRHDGIVSARRAFSFAEMRALAEAAGWQDFGHARFLLCRQALWLDQRQLGDIPLADADVLPCPT